MKTYTKLSLILCLFLLGSISAQSQSVPIDLKFAQSISSGNWNNSAIWSNNLVPDDSTFVVINSGHSVTMTSNARCESLQIKQNGTLDIGSHELLIRFMHWAHGVNWPDDDGGTDPGYIWPLINSNWDITNPNNYNWNIFLVDGTLAGTGNIVFSLIDDEDNQTNAFGGTLAGNGNITNTGSICYRELGSAQVGLKFNSACHLSFYCDLNLTDVDYPNNGGTAMTAKNYGTINLKGNADMVAGASFGTFNNFANASIKIENGSLYMGPFTSTVDFFVNEGLIQLQNGNLYIPSQSYISNRDSLIINGSILGIDSVDGSSSLIQEMANCVVAVTGEIFPATNIGCFDCSSPYAIEPNYVIYNGAGPQSIAVPRMAMEPASYIPYSNLVINNTSSAGLTLTDNISVKGILTLTDGLVNLGSHNLKLTEAASVAGTPSVDNMVVATGTGELRKTFTAPGIFTFPVGDNDGTAEYSPVMLNITDGTFNNTYIGVNLVDMAFPGVTENYLTRYWNLASSGISGLNCIAHFDYVPADVTGIEDSIYCFRVAPTTDSYDIANTNLHQLTANGLTSFGTFTGKQQDFILPPSAFAVTGSGSYCEGAEGVPVGLSGSEISVTYTLFKDGNAQQPTLAGTGSAISFGNQLFGMYTVSGSNSNGTTPMTGNALITENPSPLVSWPTFEPHVLCINWAPPVPLTGGIPEGGTYSGDGVSGNTFDPALAGEGTHTITYTFTDANNCTAEASQLFYVDLCTGMEELSSQWAVYPNPASESVSIRMLNSQSVKEVSLYNAFGMCVYADQELKTSGIVYVPVQNLPAGSYILKVTSQSSTLVKLLIIK